MVMEKLNAQYGSRGFASNCGACGAEHLSTELKEIVLLGWKLQLCKTCRSQDTYSDYNEVYDAVKKVKGQ